ncbi:MAG: hypothetical protein AAF560_14455 [Acidobacteriota bacterium]
MLGAVASIHTAIYLWDLFLAVGKRGMFFCCCLGCLSPFLVLPFVWLVPWNILLGVVAIVWTCVAALGLTVGARRKRELIEQLEQISELEYPFDFYTSVSRRFSSEAAVELFNGLVQPALEGQGEVLECWYASESHEDPDYWVARMDLLFTISDIHLLLDIDSSPATRHEVKLSHKLVLRPNSTYLRLIFPEHHDIHLAYSVPFCIHISRRGPACRINFAMRRVNIRLRSARDIEAFPERLGYVIGIVKALRLLNAEQIRQRGGSILNASWQAEDYGKLMAFHAARRQLAMLLGPSGREALLELMERIDPLKKAQIRRLNSITQRVFEVEATGRTPSLRLLYSSMRDMFYHGASIDGEAPKNQRLFLSALASSLAAFFAPFGWFYLKLLSAGRWRRAKMKAYGGGV